MSNRDDFSEKIRNAVAARAGWHCSLCKRLTIGPSEEGPDRTIKIGVAAHIAAAASGPGARRYDASMMPEARAGIGNAIWLCSNDATLIDRDDVAYSVARLQSIKNEHELSIARDIKTGTHADLATGLLAIGPNVVCTGELAGIAAGNWTLRLAHFLIGDIHVLVSFIDGFAKLSPENRYVLSNELGDGRVLAGAPSLSKDADGYSLLCPVASSFPRIEAHKLGSSMAIHPETGDLFLDEDGSIACVSGIDYLPQKIQTLLSMNRGENVFSPSAGMRFSEYFEAFRGSPWLDLLLTLDVVRQAAVPYQDAIMRQQYTPLQCVTRVCSVELLADIPTRSRIPVRITLDLKGVGEWSRELSIYIPQWSR